MDMITPGTLVIFNSAILCTVIAVLWNKLIKLEERTRGELLEVLDRQRAESKSIIEAYQKILVENIQSYARLVAAIKEDPDGR